MKFLEEGRGVSEIRSIKMIVLLKDKRSHGKSLKLFVLFDVIDTCSEKSKKFRMIQL